MLDLVFQIKKNKEEEVIKSNKRTRRVNNKITPIDRRWISSAKEAAKYSLSKKRQVGAIIARNEILLSRGWNKTPRFYPYGETECQSTLETHPYTIHAEADAIIMALQQGYNVEDATIYCTHMPCIKRCAPLIAHAGITRVVYIHGHNEEDDFSKKFLQDCGIEVISYYED
jgi:dCMP deaminase